MFDVTVEISACLITRSPLVDHNAFQTCNTVFMTGLEYFD